MFVNNVEKSRKEDEKCKALRKNEVLCIKLLLYTKQYDISTLQILQIENQLDSLRISFVTSTDTLKVQAGK